MPEQPVDSLVDVRVRLQRSDLNAIRAETGYGFEEGLEISGEYIRRNFLGGARRLTVSGILNTTIGERTPTDAAPSTRRRLAVSLLQPFIFRRSMSALGSVFYDRIIDRAAQEEEFGGSADLFYELKPYRTWSSGIQITRVHPLKVNPDVISETFIRGLLSSSASFGRTDDHISPTEGYLIRPSVEIGTPVLLSDVKYVKWGLSGTLYKRVGRNGGVAFRLFRGRLVTYGGVTEEEALTSDRYDRTRFYAGGSDDVRGWSPQLLGPKEAIIVEADTLWDPNGTLDKWLGNAAYRFPLPFTPPQLQWAIFADGAKLSSDEIRIGAGLGFRYQTPVGFIRFDVAYKVNPSPEDLRNAADVVSMGLENAPTSNLRRFRLHFGIGQAF
jgi:outer membrane protein insertion porin family